MSRVEQIHVATGGLVQTLAAVETENGITLLSSFSSASGRGDGEMHIPAAARAWLAAVAGRVRNA